MSKIALLGSWRHRPMWRTELIGFVESLRNEHMPEVVLDWLEETPIVNCGYFPEDASAGLIAESMLAQQQALAQRANITVYVDNGKWSEAKKRHLERLYDRTGALVLWLPEEMMLPEKEEADVVGAKPGEVLEQGSIDNLAAVILYLCGSR